MKFRATPYGYLLVLEPGEELIRSLTSFARREDVDAGTLAGIGAVDFAELGFFHIPSETYERHVFEEPLEVCSLTGNLALLDGEPFPHVHAVLGRRDFSTVGGHVFQAVCSITLELTIQVIPVPIMRAAGEFGNTKLLRLEGSP